MEKYREGEDVTEAHVQRRKERGMNIQLEKLDK